MKTHTITIGYNRSDKASVNYILQNNSEMRVGNRELKAQVMEIFGLDRKFRFSFDMVKFKGLKMGEEVVRVKKKDITLVKIRTTARHLPDFPHGFHFSTNKLDMELAKNKYFEFCFVCLHAQSRSAVFLDLAELNSLIKKKRIKYEIGL